MRTWFFTTLATLGLALQGCGEPGGSGGASGGRLDRGAADRLLDRVASGESILTFEGVVSADGAYTTGNDPRYAGESFDVYQPVQSGDQAGMNETGPYMISIFTDARHQDDPDNTVRAWITVSLPRGAGPGTYAAASPSDAQDDDAVVTVAGDGYGWRYQREVEGHVHVLKIGETLTAAWEFDARRRRAEPGVTARGGVRDLAFSPQSEAEFTIEDDQGSERFEHRVAVHTREGRPHTVALSRNLYLDIPADAPGGTVPIRRRREAPDDITVTFPDHAVQAVEGEARLEREGGRLTGEFTVRAVEGDTVSAQGRFVIHDAGPE